MDRQLVEKLAQKLIQRCPVDTGSLRASISGVQGNESEWIITIGNNDSGANGRVPTIQYAHITNFNQTLYIRGQQYVNPNYHWVNKAVNEWLQENKMLLDLESDNEMEVDIE